MSEPAPTHVPNTLPLPANDAPPLPPIPATLTDADQAVDARKADDSPATQALSGALPAPEGDRTEQLAPPADGATLAQRELPAPDDATWGMGPPTRGPAEAG